jgi:hypothetical protein
MRLEHLSDADLETAIRKETRPDQGDPSVMTPSQHRVMIRQKKRGSSLEGSFSGQRKPDQRKG